MNFNEALLAKLDKIIEKMETFENIVANIEQKVQQLTNANDSTDALNPSNNINLSSSSSGNKFDSDHSWNASTDLKYRQGITPDQRRRENRQSNLYRSSSQGSGISLRQVTPHQQNDIRRMNKPSRPSSTDINNKSTITSNAISTKSNITNNISSNNINAIDNKKKILLTPQKTENKSPTKVETSPSQQQQTSSPPKTRNTVVFFPDNEDDLQFDED